MSATLCVTRGGQRASWGPCRTCPGRVWCGRTYPGIRTSPTCAAGGGADPAAEPAEPHLAGQPPPADARPHQERLRFQRGDAHPGRILRAGEDEEPRHPDRAELGIELGKDRSTAFAGDLS